MRLSYYRPRCAEDLFLAARHFTLCCGIVLCRASIDSMQSSYVTLTTPVSDPCGTEVQKPCGFKVLAVLIGFQNVSTTWFSRVPKPGHIVWMKERLCYGIAVAAKMTFCE